MARSGASGKSHMPGSYRGREEEHESFSDSMQKREIALTATREVNGFIASWWQVTQRPRQKQF